MNLSMLYIPGRKVVIPSRLHPCYEGPITLQGKHGPTRSCGYPSRAPQFDKDLPDVDKTCPSLLPRLCYLDLEISRLVRPLQCFPRPMLWNCSTVSVDDIIQNRRS